MNMIEYEYTKYMNIIYINIYIYLETWYTYLNSTCMHIDSAQTYWFWYRQKTNVASEHALSQKGSSLPTTVFQQRTVAFRGLEKVYDIFLGSNIFPQQAEFWKKYFLCDFCPF